MDWKMSPTNELYGTSLYDQMLLNATEESHISILSGWVGLALLSSCLLHTQSYIGVTGKVNAGLGTRPCHEQTEQKKLRLTETH